MSLILFLFYWLGIPGAVILAGIWIWRRATSPIAKGFGLIAYVAVLAGFLWLAVGKTWWIDQQVKELCAKDGGNKVYETVKLPAYMFNKWGQFSVPDKLYMKPSDEYYSKSEDTFLKQGNPQLWRYHTLIFRQSDGKLLGEAVLYGRGGGGLPGPWHGSSFNCPDLTKQKSIESSIFLKAE
jgi:hypothetical protein